MTGADSLNRHHMTLTGEGPVIVFVHGNASTRDIWKEVTPALSEQFSCVTYDLRGHGQGPALDGKLTLEQLVDDLDRIRAATGQERVALVGHSLGAFVVASYAHRFADRIAWCSLMAMPAGRTAADKDAAKDLLKRLKAEGVGETVPHLVRLWYTQAFVTAHPGYLQRRLDQLLEIDDAVFTEFYQLYNRVSVDKLLREIACPTLVMTGEFARGAGADTARFVAGRLPSAELRIFPEVKNGLMTEIPQQIGQALLNFATKQCEH
ncbi:MAG: alpha/beta hydrolase [Roseovarius sp.]